MALTVEKAAVAGLAGCCIEDIQSQNAIPYDFIKAVERIEAGVEAAKNFRQKTGADFVLTARADGILLTKYGLDEAIKRLRAFEKAGADVLYAPMHESMDDLARICNSLGKPVNALCVGSFSRFAVEDFAAIGVARISLGSTMARVIHKAIMDCGRAMFESGDMSALGEAASGKEIDVMLSGRVET